MNILDKYAVETDLDYLMFVGYKRTKKVYGINKHRAKYVSKLIDGLYDLKLEESFVRGWCIVESSNIEDEIKRIELIREENMRKIESLINRKFISVNKYYDLYIVKLKEDLGKSAIYDDFVNWLEAEKEYGIVNSMCESYKYGNLRKHWENETLTIEVVENNIREDV